MRCITRYRSLCKYEEDLCIQRDGDEQAPALLQSADWIIQLGDDDYRNFWQMLGYYTGIGTAHPSIYTERLAKLGCRMATRHAGSLVRDNPKRYEKWDRFMDRIFVPCDLMSRYAMDDRAAPFLQPQEDIPSELPIVEGPVSFVHTPSNLHKKCTISIVSAVGRAQRVPFRVITGVDYDTVRRERMGHHVFIDHVNQKHGCVGGATMEALAQGQMVVVNDSYVNKCVERWFPRPPTVTVRTLSDITDVVNFYGDNLPAVNEKRQESLQWAQKYLSDEFTYNYWEEALA